MPNNKPLHSDLLDFFAYICAHFRMPSEKRRSLLSISDLGGSKEIAWREGSKRGSESKATEGKITTINLFFLIFNF